MSDTSLRAGGRASFLVKRRLRLKPLRAAAAAKPVDDGWFDGLIGFNQAVQQGLQLIISYDASRLHIDQLLVILADRGLALETSALNRFRLGWYRYLDQNIAANARDESSTACSQSPLRHR